MSMSAQVEEFHTKFAQHYAPRAQTSFLGAILRETGLLDCRMGSLALAIAGVHAMRCFGSCWVCCCGARQGRHPKGRACLLVSSSCQGIWQ
jgi:hypothetical protein